MTSKFTEIKLSGIALSRLEVENHLAAVYDVAIELTVAVSWFGDDDPQFGGPPSIKQLDAYVERLTSAYVALAIYTGMDPCEQLRKRGANPGTSEGKATSRLAVVGLAFQLSAWAPARTSEAKFASRGQRNCVRCSMISQQSYEGGRIYFRKTAVTCLFGADS